MKSKSILSQSASVLNHFNSKNQPCFEHFEVFELFDTTEENSILKLLSNMVKRGLLMRLKKGLYYIIPYEQESEAFMPDWHLIAEHLTKGTKHYIGYYSALQIHNLITQPSLKEQIVVAKQMRPSTLKIKNTSFQFIYHARQTLTMKTKSLKVEEYSLKMLNPKRCNVKIKWGYDRFEKYLLPFNY